MARARRPTSSASYESMAFDLQRANEIAEKLLDLSPWTCDVHLFSDDEQGGAYAAQVFVELVDPTVPFDISAFIERLGQLRDLLEAERVQVLSNTSLRLTLTLRD
jgi:hypothetical protein